jgi:hypothetical protein
VTLARIFDERGRIQDLAKFRRIGPSQVICELPAQNLYKSMYQNSKMDVYTVSPRRLRSRKDGSFQKRVDHADSGTKPVSILPPCHIRHEGS